MPHNPPYHLLDNNFADQDTGLVEPGRRKNTSTLLDDAQVCRATDEGPGQSNVLTLGSFGLRIANLDRANPPNYVSGGVPRGNDFNANVFQITAYPRMPRIDVQCTVTGFLTTLTPIHWRLACRHVLGRHHNVGAAEGVGAYRYRGAILTLDDEWQGLSWSDTFSLFIPPPDQPDPNVLASYNLAADDRIMGGHAILAVAAKPLGSPLWLRDHVHLRINAANPARADVLRYVDTALAGRDPNIIHAVKAIYAHEANFVQFQDDPQTSSRMRFRQGVGHSDPAQPDCNVRFDYPNDPANFPQVSFDFGVGISQQTLGHNDARTMDWWKRVSWDWRMNAREGIDEFLGKMRHTHTAHTTWRNWIWRAWRNYNGSGQQAENYANTLQASTEGAQVTNTAAPADWEPLVAALTAIADRPAAPEWPPTDVAPPDPIGSLWDLD